MSRKQQPQDIFGGFHVRVIRAGKAVKQDFPNTFISSQNHVVGSPTTKILGKRKATEELATPQASNKRPHLEAEKDKDFISFQDSWVGKSENTRVLHSFLLPIIISWNYLGQLKELSFDALVDTGADCSVFDIDFVERQLLPWTRREKPVRIRGIDGSLCKCSGKVQVKGLQIQVPDLRTGQMKKTSLQMEVMTFGDKQLNNFPLILGMDWI